MFVEDYFDFVFNPDYSVWPYKIRSIDNDDDYEFSTFEAVKDSYDEKYFYSIKDKEGYPMASYEKTVVEPHFEKVTSDVVKLSFKEDNYIMQTQLFDIEECVKSFLFNGDSQKIVYEDTVGYKNYFIVQDIFSKETSYHDVPSDYSSSRQEILLAEFSDNNEYITLTYLDNNDEEKIMNIYLSD